MRKMAQCINCGEVREIAAFSLCFRCYRQQDRAEENKFAVVDRHNPALRREHEEVMRGFTSIIAGLRHLRASRRDVLAIRRIIDPYLDLVAEYLVAPPQAEEKGSPVNSEHKKERAFTVHSVPDAIRRQADVAADRNTNGSDPGMFGDEPLEISQRVPHPEE